LATTRRGRLQLSRVRKRKSANRRAGLPVRAASSSAQVRSTSISFASRGLRARPNRKSTLFACAPKARDCVSAPGHQRLAGKPAVAAQ
jgi:hypothetical protein